jgi:NAD(P)H-hydrate epimerase
VIPKKRNNDAYKNQFGRVVVIAGSYNMSGAAQLSVSAAVRAGAGLTTLVSTKDVISRIGGFIPEAMFFPLEAAADGSFSGSDAAKLAAFLENTDAVLFGCGVTQSDGAGVLLREVLKSAPPVKIIDADGINLLSKSIELLKEAKGTTVLTPHAGELSRLCGKDADNRSDAALGLFAEYGAFVVAKGVPTYICGSEQTAVNAGNPGLAKGGSGDVLAGIIAAFCAKEADTEEALKAAVAVHGKAADLACEIFGETSMTASDLVGKIPEAVMRICYHE